MIKNNKKGFTLIELLVVIAIIGLLSTLAVVSLNSARAKARDAKRISEMKNFQSALEMYYSDKLTYPTSTLSLAAGEILGNGNAMCLDDSGLDASCAGTVYMNQINKDPQGNQTYTYTTDANGTTYTVAFTLENLNPSLGTTRNCRFTSTSTACTY